MTLERALERRGLRAANDDGVLAMLHEERGGDLGEIGRGVAAEEEQRPVADDRRGDVIEGAFHHAAPRVTPSVVDKVDQHFPHIGVRVAKSPAPVPMFSPERLLQPILRLVDIAS